MVLNDKISSLLINHQNAPLRLPQTTLRLLQRCIICFATVGMRTFALFPTSGNRSNTAKTAVLQPILLIRFSIRGELQRCISRFCFSNRGNCNVAIIRLAIVGKQTLGYFQYIATGAMSRKQRTHKTCPLFVLCFVGKRTFAIFSLQQQSYNFAKQRIFKAFNPSARLCFRIFQSGTFGICFVSWKCVRSTFPTPMTAIERPNRIAFFKIFCSFVCFHKNCNVAFVCVFQFISF